MELPSVAAFALSRMPSASASPTTLRRTVGTPNALGPRGLRGLALGCAFGAARSRLRRGTFRHGRGDRCHARSTSTRATDVEFEYKIDLEGLVSLCKRRGFVFPSGEIYGGYNGFFDYGPLGAELKNNLKRMWWRRMVHMKDDVIGLDSSIVTTPSVHQASGHVDNFSDPMVDCTESKKRFRADQLLWAKVEQEDGTVLGYVSMVEDGDVEKAMAKAAKKLAKDRRRLRDALRGAFGAFHSVQKNIWRVFGLKSTNSFDVARGARSECVGMGAIGCRCTDGADGGTEASAEDDVVAISAISDTTVVKKDKNRLEDSRKKLVACARALRARLAKEQADVWKKAEAEFNVQKMIWQSLSLQRGAKHQGTAAMIESKLEFAMQSHTKNLTAAVEALDACVQRNEGLDLLGVAMIESIEAIKRSAAHADSRQELAALLDKAAEEIGSGVVSRRGLDLRFYFWPAAMNCCRFTWLTPCIEKAEQAPASTRAKFCAERASKEAGRSVNLDAYRKYSRKCAGERKKLLEFNSMEETTVATAA